MSTVPGFETIPLDHFPAVEKLRQRLHQELALSQNIFLDYCPGNGTRYELFIQVINPANIMELTQQGATAEAGKIQGRYRGHILVTLLNFRTSMVLSDLGCPNPHYVQEKLKVTSADAASLAYLLSAAPGKAR